jgi:ectoine hydroxylase-related dioxygenase (phytanoyl-CoA dioxygenase family)
MPSVDEVVKGLEADGYFVVERFLSPDRVEAMKADLHRILESTPTGRNDFEGYSTKRIYALFAKTRCFDDLAIDPLVWDVTAKIIGPWFQLSAPTGIHIGPGEPAQILHHDDSIYPLPKPHQEVVLNTMWAFDDFVEANGATRMVPGSHLWDADRTPTPDETVPMEMPAGSVMFYLGSVWHGGGANQTERPRLGVILEFIASWLRAQENHLLAVPPAVVATLPERLQELLGYNIYPPFMGYVDGRHPRRVLEAPTER